MKKYLLLVDGYNMIGYWPQLVNLKNNESIEAARNELLHILSDYAKYEGIETWVIFDAQLVPGMTQQYDQYQLTVVFTEEGQTADSYIESFVAQNNNLRTQVIVATSDLAEQRLVFQLGALRKSANELYKDIKKTKETSAHDIKHSYSKTFRRNSPWKGDQIEKLQEYLNHLSATKKNRK